MNPLTNVKNLNKINEKELQLGVAGSHTSWHAKYKDSAWIFVGGLPYDLTEGDVVCVFSQYGEIVNINMVRDNKTGKSKGYGFMCYEDQRSTILAVDNLNGFKLLGRTLRVDHVENYRQPKDTGDEDEITKKLREEGCAPKVQEHRSESESEEELILPIKKEKKKKKKKEKKNKKTKKKKAESSTESSSAEEGTSVMGKKYRDRSESPVRMKKERLDTDYDKYNRDAHHADNRSDYNRSSVEEERERLRRDDNRDRYREYSPQGGKNERKYKEDRYINSKHVKIEKETDSRRREKRYEDDLYSSKERDKYKSRDRSPDFRNFSGRRDKGDYDTRDRSRECFNDRESYDKREHRYNDRDNYDNRDRYRERRRSRSRSRSSDRYPDYR